MYPNDEYIRIIRGRLRDKRFTHSLAVADEAKRLAGKYGADAEKAYTAGLLHDVMKETDGDLQLAYLKEHGVLLTPLERSSPKLWHAMSGAAFVAYDLHLEDREILAAIRYHTTARAGMSRLEKVLYLADFTSADRDYEDVDEIRRRVEISMPCGMEYALQYSIRDLVLKNKAIHPDTLNAYNETILEGTEKHA